MRTTIRYSPRAGMAMMVVLALSVVILAVGMSMIGLTGNVMMSSVDAKTKVKSRYAAESATSIAIAEAVFKAGQTFGGNLDVAHQSFASGSDAGSVDVSFGNNLGQEVILQKRSPMNGMRGNKIPLTMESSGKSGGGKSRITASVALYQVPIYQFGVFYEENLEITPGMDMVVYGRVHTNASAWFRAAGSKRLQFEGPVTTVGSIKQWVRPSGNLYYQYAPTNLSLYGPSLSQTLATMTVGPPPVGGVSNVRWNETRLTLAIGVGTPHSILGVCNSSDPEALKRQKFDCMVQDSKKADATKARFVYTGTPPNPSLQPFITGPRVFYDRRELNWVKVWDFDVAAIPASVTDSIFYLDDVVNATDKSGLGIQVINAFRIKNAAKLPRNMTIACGKPLYIMGDFNSQDASGNISAAGYKNAQIASDAVTLLSSNWPNWKAVGSSGSWPASVNASNSSMEQPFGNSNWVDNSVCNGCQAALAASRSSSSQVPTGNYGVTSGVVARINAAIITGNKPSTASCLSGAANENDYEACYEGGWHNTIRFLEDWGKDTVRFKGSFVCMWGAQTIGLRAGSATNPVIRGGHYQPPTRYWGYDTRFDELYNMPPGTPFLATAIVTNWLERN